MGESMTFKQFLDTRQISDTLTGAFIQRTRNDVRLPELTTWREMRGYLCHRYRVRRTSSQSQLVEVARQVWRYYQRELQKGTPR